MYPPELVAPMKSDLTEAGFSELISEADVDAALAKEGTTLVVLNSVCGCAAGSMRPGVKLAVQHSKVPTNLTTAFAGVDREAVDRARKFMLPYPSFFALRGSVQGRSFGGHGGASPYRRPNRRDDRRSPQDGVRRILLSTHSWHAS